MTSARPTLAPNEAPLSGVRVLDFSRVLAGPYGTMHLADLGADVVKVERPVRGDDTRHYGPPDMDGVSTYFLSVNRGKRSVALDLKSADDRALARRLCIAADVVVENFRPGVMERLGLGPDGLLSDKPGLIYATIRGFADPDDPRPGYDLMMQGLSGVPSITGPVDGPPSKCGASIADMASGMHMVQAILAALVRKARSGRGAHVVVPLFDAQTSLLSYHAGAYLNGGQAPTRRGNAHPSIHPFCVLQTADGWLCLCIGNDDLWSRFCVAAGVPAWATDERFATNRRRVAHRDALDALLHPLVRARPLAAWLALLARSGVPGGPMNTIPEALAEAETVVHPHPVSGAPVHSLPMPMLIDGARPVAERGASELGADRDAVFSDWLAD
ncbi:MAG: CoA transferase [Myxococcota bacterium]|nr:CoA transferase [Myxococcota bacterium]